MDQITTTVIGTVIAAFIVHLLRIGNSRTVVTVRGVRPTRTWKIMIVIGWAMMIYGGYLAIHNSPYGLNILGIGFIVELLGEFLLWFNRN